MQEVITTWEGLLDYETALERMLAYTDSRDPQTADAIWFLEHPAVYTLGTSCKTKVTDNPDDIPVVQSNRGGQITYHGPGQLIAYLLFDIKRMGIGPKRLVQTIEQVIINVLGQYGLTAERRAGAPGVYIDDRKIAALGLRIRNGSCFHGLSINVDMDMSPFERIEPCGIAGLEVTQLTEHGITTTVKAAANDVLRELQRHFEWSNLSSPNIS